MILVVRRRTLVFAALGGVLLAFALLALPRAAVETLAPVYKGRCTYVIDAGHGGEDGGAVARDGTVESGINLAVARRLDALLTFLGEKSVMTRREDISIYSAGAETLHEKKASDLRNRVSLVNETEGSLLVSIHQNSLPSSPRTRGAQVFYGAAEGSEAAAERVQRALNASVNGGGEKRHKPIAPGIYLMSHVHRPAILIECGFLSNAEETALLKREAYQTRLAYAIAAGLLQEETAEESE